MMSLMYEKFNYDTEHLFHKENHTFTISILRQNQVRTPINLSHILKESLYKLQHCCVLYEFYDGLSCITHNHVYL